MNTFLKLFALKFSINKLAKTGDNNKCNAKPSSRAKIFFLKVIIMLMLYRLVS